LISKLLVSKEYDGNKSPRAHSSPERPTTGEGPSRELLPKSRGARLRSQITGWTRFVTYVPVIALLAASIMLTIVGAIDTVKTGVDIFRSGIDSKSMTVEFVELADLFLLSIVLYITSIGLYELFIDPDVKLPDWLHFHNIDDLKASLASVIIVMLAVLFLGSVIEECPAMNVLLRGAGIGGVIFALAFYLRTSHKKG